jgi:hypothetical protein
MAPVAKPVAPPPGVGAPPQGVASPLVAAAPQGFRDRHERLFLVIACVVAAGALAIPRLLRSKAFGPFGKTVLGVCAALNTTVALGCIVFLAVNGPNLLARYVKFIQSQVHHF